MAKRTEQTTEVPIEEQVTTVEPTTTEAPIEEQEAPTTEAPIEEQEEQTTEAPTCEEPSPAHGPVPEGTAFGSTTAEAEATTDFSPLIDDLRKKGSTQLTADTREALASFYKALKSQACGIYIATGAVARMNEGKFIMKIFNIVKK